METGKNISFSAIRLNPIKIKQKAGNTWKQVDASFIRFNPKQKDDRRSITLVSDLWQGKNMSSSIAEEADICKDPVYAITTQKENFKNIDPAQVLGMFTTDSLKKANGSIEIYRIGVNPSSDYSLGKKLRAYKEIGKQMVQEFVKVLKKEKQIDRLVIASEPENYKFYNKLGMTPRENSIGVFELKRENFDSFLK